MEQEFRRRAEERIERRFSFFAHLIIYLVVNTGIFLVWFFVTDHGKGFPWFVIVLAGWGIGLISHLLSVFVFDKMRDRMIDKEITKMKDRHIGKK